MTSEEYLKETFRILVKDTQYRDTRPCEIRQRVENLLAIERRSYVYCKLKYFKQVFISKAHEKAKINHACPYCGWDHK